MHGDETEIWLTRDELPGSVWSTRVLRRLALQAPRLRRSIEQSFA
jgi:hypothetical protein